MRQLRRRRNRQHHRLTPLPRSQRRTQQPLSRRLPTGPSSSTSTAVSWCPHSRASHCAQRSKSRSRTASNSTFWAVESPASSHLRRAATCLPDKKLPYVSATSFDGSADLEPKVSAVDCAASALG